MDNVVYREEVPLTQWALIMVGLFITILTPTILLEALAVYKEPWSLWLYGFLDLFFIVILLNFRKLDIEIDETHLVASFGYISKKIKLNTIISCEPIDATLSVYTGMGLRYGGDGSLAYLPSLGEAVKLTIKEDRAFVFSTRNQKLLIEIIQREIKHKDE